MSNRNHKPCDVSIGVDLGDKRSHVAVLKRGGEIVLERTIASTRGAFRKFFSAQKPVRVVMEAGTHSAWASELVGELGHEPVVANAQRAGVLLRSSGRKSDKLDALGLAGFGLDSVFLLKPIEHRKRAAQIDLMTIRARDSLVRARTSLINAVRSHAKVLGERIATSSSAAFHKRARESLPEELSAALSPVIDQIEQLTESIRGYDKQIEELSAKYPETRKLRAVVGVGSLTALSFVLTLEEPHRFKTSRKVGAYLGLVPRESVSGMCQPQLRISKAGNAYLRKILVSAAHYILGPFGGECELRRYGERISARGGKNAKKRAVVAVARKLAVLLHRRWISDERYDPEYQSRAKELRASA